MVVVVRRADQRAPKDQGWKELVRPPPAGTIAPARGSASAASRGSRLGHEILLVVQFPSQDAMARAVA